MKRVIWCSAVLCMAFCLNGLQGSALGCNLTTSSTLCGSVAEPGEGVFHYSHRGVEVAVVAEPDSGCQFVRWECSNPDSVADACSAITTVTMSDDLTLRAFFVGPPECSTYSAKQITCRSAVLWGGVVADGQLPNGFRFHYWEKNGPQMVTEWEGPIVDCQRGYVRVTNLRSDTTYYFEMETKNKVGTALGEVREFTTLATTDNFSSFDVIYVDDDASADPGPRDILVSDPDEDGSQGHPFDSIQEALVVAKPQGVQIVVRSGRYYETIDFLGKRVAVTSCTEPNTPDDLVFPVIDGGNAGTVVRFANGEQVDSVLRGFVLTGGFDGTAGAVLCDGASPSLKNCLLVGNRAVGPLGAAVYCANSQARITNCTISGNYGGAGAALVFVQESNPVVKNSIMWDNAPLDLQNLSTLPVQFYYNDSTAMLEPGQGNIVVDPVFVAPGIWVDRNDPTVQVTPDVPNAVWLEGDYHLMSQAGRWNPLAGEWVEDDVTSPCIDAADPLTPWETEAGSNGDRANMGAYGGTTQASLSM
jgi:hypothetical protein